MESLAAQERIRPARAEEAPAIARLVNQAYRPRHPVGWTHEAHLIAGERIRAEGAADLITRPDSLVLVGVAADAILACVHLEPHGDEARIGLLAVHPRRQGGGLGGRMLAAAERQAVERYALPRAVLHVLRARTELLAFYLRRGYIACGRQEPFPLAAGYGRPRPGADTVLEVLVKAL